MICGKYKALPNTGALNHCQGRFKKSCGKREM
jgi:hypothetical protein